MKTYYITFRSVTYAQRGEQVLKRAGMRSMLQRTPRWMEAQGCGYALRLWSDTVQNALTILQEGHVPIRRVYVQLPDGQLEEVSV